VLVVDDEEVALLVIPEALRDGLEDLGWHNLTIETASSGEEALEVAASCELHLLVTDVVMPGIDGIETFARLKESNSNLACVVMTAQAPEHSTPIRALRLGAADYVRKPIQPDYLVETCHRQLVVHHLRRNVSESRRLLEAVVDSVADGVIAVREQNLLVANRAAYGLFEADEQTLLERMEAQGISRTAMVDSAAQSTHEFILRRDDGTSRTVNVAIAPVMSRGGARLGDVFSIQDVTDVVTRKQMESFKRMAAIAAHEMKNSVTGLGLITEHLVARLDSGALDAEEAQRMARIILDSVARLDRFARSFLGFSRIPEPKCVTISVNSLVEDALSLYDRERGLPEWVELKTTLSSDLPAISADPDLMFQVLQNLILNAVEAMESTRTGGLVVSTSEVCLRENKYCTISVSDEGDGVPEHLRDAIFEPNVTTREAGSGLGLVIVRDIVHKHSGHIRLRSQEGEGATFEVLLPVADENPGDRE
jgi:nitrogen fixation/metabolism regulation signal transduction histidine kinase